MLPCEIGRAVSMSGVMAADSGDRMEICDRGELDEQKDDCGVNGGGVASKWGEIMPSNGSEVGCRQEGCW